MNGARTARDRPPLPVVGPVADATPDAPEARTIRIVGLGNPVLGDDGIGWRVAEEVRHMLAESDSPIAVDCLAVGGLRLMEHLIGSEAAILIDAIETGHHPPGSVTSFPLEALGDPLAGHLGSTHDASLPTALALGRALGAPLPGQVWIVAVETRLNLEFTEALSPPVAAAIAPAAHEVLAILHDLLSRED